MAGSRLTKRLLVGGGLLVACTAIAMTALGLYFDATGGGPNDALTVVVWSVLLLGLLLLVGGVVRAVRNELRRGR